MRVLIAAHYASEDLGGEASIPLRLFDRLRARGVDAWLVTHDSGADALRDWFGADRDRLVLTPSLPGLAPFFRWSERLPAGARELAWSITQVERLYAMRGPIRELVRRLGIDVVHQPIGVAPAIPSPLTALGAPLVVGPLNGGMTLPPSFRERDSALVHTALAINRSIGNLAHRLIPGKAQAEVVLVANERTRALLPRAPAARAHPMPETAVVLGDWPVKDHTSRPVDDPVRFIYTGRLVAYKAADLLLDAFAQVVQQVDARLDVVGDGPFRPFLEQRTRDLGLAQRVTFHGWRSLRESSDLLRAADVYVLPTLREPGGISVLEAMASGLPCVVADWGGPAEFVGDTGLRVGVTPASRFVPRLAEAMSALARAPERRAELGAAARARVEARYDWDTLTDRLIGLYGQAAAGGSATPAPVPAPAPTSTAVPRGAEPDGGAR